MRTPWPPGTAPEPRQPCPDGLELGSRHLVAGWRGEVGLKARRIWGRILASLRGISLQEPLRSVGRGKRMTFFYRTCSIFHIATCSIALRISGIPACRRSVLIRGMPGFRLPRMSEKVHFPTCKSRSVKSLPSFKEMSPVLNVFYKCSYKIYILCAKTSHARAALT